MTGASTTFGDEPFYKYLLNLRKKIIENIEFH